MGKRRYSEARELFITADAGGSNGYRAHAWKHGLQKFADETQSTSPRHLFPARYQQVEQY